ncbi:signal recognition particle protein [Elstera cyanobacteriorum]|uniref:Signal recognition particle protein n=1 Tax=Elstera cyanobacteriorum TaxID=2022747 RepID=A0A255XL57_9PROT|nr:signal recognition particle protein [Elstera cyanobacteriorum]OYQ17010.1 signal recognition particle protein [Elstera cyanobacteriorum]GFZ82696.1 signal recognition particle protein [Elstera cyanobacteriorum]
MFEGLSNRLGEVFDRLKKRGALSESDVSEALREVRIALLEADVALPVVKDFINSVKERAVGAEVIKSITPGQMVVKIVHDHLVELLGGTVQTLDLVAAAPVVVMMVGLQGSGKTTSTAKIAKRLSDRDRKKILMASLDVARPAAQEQLAVLGRQVSVATLPIVPGQPPVEIAKRALMVAKTEGYDVLMLDTAGRLAIDDALMAEVEAVRDATHPAETLLVADAMTGQDAVNTARIFNERVGLTGIVLTRIDGDARGGAALAMRSITGKPIKLLGTGEKMDALEDFHPDRIAGRILGMGDVVSLVEKAAATIDQAEAEKLAAKMQKGTFDLDDFLSQLRQLKKMGGMGGLMGMLPGIAKVKKQMSEAKIDDGMLKRQEAIILSMTKAERRDPKLLNAKRRVRIAKGSGTDVADVNRLIKQFGDMQKMMKQVQAMGKSGKLAKMMPQLQNMMGKGGFPR